MIDIPQTNVLVVGAGPVGLTLALDLARRSIPCRIIDQAATYPIGTRGRGINARTQEVFEALAVCRRAPLSGSGKLCYTGPYETNIQNR